MSAYDLRAAVKHVLATSSLTDPGEIADKVAESIPAKSLRAVVREMLRAYVRQINNEGRTYSPPNFQPSSSGHPNRDTHTQSAAAGRSSKVRAIREGWQRQLTVRYHVGHGVHKMQVDMTYDDFMFGANERDSIAERNSAWARVLRARAGLLTEHDVETFGDLPVEVQMAALGGAA